MLCNISRIRNCTRRVHVTSSFVKVIFRKSCRRLTVNDKNCIRLGHSVETISRCRLMHPYHKDRESSLRSSDVPGVRSHARVTHTFVSDERRLRALKIARNRARLIKDSPSSAHSSLPACYARRVPDRRSEKRRARQQETSEVMRSD